MYFTVVLGMFILFLCYIFSNRNAKSILPIGPRGIPLLGNIHQFFVKNPYQKLSQLASTYGKIYTINLGTSPAVVINEPKLMRAILSTFPATNKFQTDSVLRMSQGPYGVLNSDGESWAEQRTFCVKKMKEFGFGAKQMENLILAEAETVCDWINKSNSENNNSLIQIQLIFMQSVNKAIFTMVTDTRIFLGDSEIVKVMNTFVSTFQYTTKTGLAFLPWLKYFAPGLSGYTAYDKACVNVWKYIENEFNDHKQTYVQGAQRDLIDAYIEHAGGDELKWKNSVATVVELFLAGSESTSATLTWLLFYLSQNQEIQKKIQDEIDTVIDGMPTLNHKAKMPFTEAVILETFRMSSYTPIGAIHKLSDNLEIENWKFPKGLLLIPNMYHCHYDKRVWGDPEVFRPERFLGESGQSLKEHVIPFQLGKRQCLGEPFAKDIIFIFVTKMFQMFNVKPDGNVDPKKYYEADVGYLLFPPTLGLFITARGK